MLQHARALVPPELDGERLDRAAARLLGRSRGWARRTLELGGLYLDGRRLRVASRPVRAGQRLDAWWMEPPEPEPPELRPEHLLLREPGWVAVDKPPGLWSQAARHRLRGTLPDQLRRLLGGRPEPAHRLDRDASGVVLLCLGRAERAALARAFREGRVRKLYLAVAEGPLRPGAEGVLELPVGPDPRRPGRHRSGDFPGARPARSRYRLLAAEGQRLLLLFEPLTGRTHQLRLHALALGAPILGDRLYAPRLQARAAPRLCLHAWRLELPEGVLGPRRRLEAPPPPLFAELLGRELPLPPWGPPG